MTVLACGAERIAVGFLAERIKVAQSEVRSTLQRCEMAGGDGGKSSHPGCHFAASAIAAVVNFPLWKASAIGQSGFDKSLKHQHFLQR